MKNSLQWRHLQEEGKFMARPQHSPTPSSTQAPATPFESRTRTKPEEKHLCRRWTKKIPKKDPQVLLQAGRIKPISDRSPHKLTSGAIEAVNGIIQFAKRMARGFRNFVYFRTAAYHRAGQLKLVVSCKNKGYYLAWVV